MPLGQAMQLVPLNKGAEAEQLTTGVPLAFLIYICYKIVRLRVLFWMTLLLLSTAKLLMKTPFRQTKVALS